MRRFYSFLLILLSLCTGTLFIYSAYTKLFPIQSFQYTITEFLHVPSMMAGIAARFFTGLEAGLGALIILQFFGGGKWVLKTALGLMAVFSAYLVWLWVVAGNNVNCGCFGDAIWMNPSASLLKNVVLLVVLWLLIRYHSGFEFRWLRIVNPLILVGLMAAVFIFFPVFHRYKIDLGQLYANPASAPAIDLSKGKHIVAFLNPSCIHCRRAALKMHNMELADTSLPFYMVIGGLTSNLKDFWAASDAERLPHSRLDAKPFQEYTGGSTPAILWINDGWVEASTDYTELSDVVIRKWMR